MTQAILQAQRTHLGQLLDAIQRSTYYLHATEQRLPWPLTAPLLEAQKKNAEWFETLAAMNERFAKLQDILASAMRHTALLMGEPTDTFLQVLAWFEKQRVIDSIEQWQLLRTARNLAAHDYETDYEQIAEHFNTLHALSPVLYSTAGRLVRLCQQHLHLTPARGDFASEFNTIALSNT